MSHDPFPKELRRVQWHNGADLTPSTEERYATNPSETFTDLRAALHRVALSHTVSRELAKEVYDLWCATFPKANLDTPAAWSAWKRSVDEHNAKAKL